MLFNEPKLLKCGKTSARRINDLGFSALQRAEIAEIVRERRQRPRGRVSVLFNEPKLLKSCEVPHAPGRRQSFSALQRAEIAEIAADLARTER